MTQSKYKQVNELPPGAMTVKGYAEQVKKKPAYIYVRYNRYLNKNHSHPGYDLVTYQGVIFVINQ